MRLDMEEKKLDISWKEYASREELSEKDRQLLDAAINALAGSYAPYSHFNVGSAVRLGNDIIVRGANQENSAFPSGLCAERTAMFSAGATYPDKEMLSIAIAGGVYGKVCADPATPCGACRQVMAQYQAKSGKPMSVIMVGGRRTYKFDKVDDILPLIFDSI